MNMSMSMSMSMNRDRNKNMTMNMNSKKPHLRLLANPKLIELPTQSIQSSYDISGSAVHHNQVDVAGWQIQPCSQALAHFVTKHGCNFPWPVGSAHFTTEHDCNFPGL